ncbi:MAG: ABC transporter ATP-binding protein, partial [Cyanobacteria bacterium P01_D01_bin.115]
TQFVLQVVGNGLLVIGVLGILWIEDWRAGLSLSLFALAAFGILARLQTLAVVPWRTYRQISAEFYGFVTEHLSGLEDIRANGAVGYVMNRLYRILRQWLAAFHRARFTSTLLWSSTVSLFTLGNAIALTIGAYLWSRDAITIGTVYLIFYYATLLRDPIERIREELEQLQQTSASFQRIQNLLNQQSQLRIGGQAVLPRGALSVAFEGVWFGYEATPHPPNFPSPQLPVPVLQNLTFHLPAGQILGILGRTGSGKSTLARLLLRLYDIQQGQICLGNVDIAQVPLAELPRHVGFVTQDVQLFQTTVRHNLTFFDPHIQDEHILRTLEALDLLPWLQRLPQGLDTALGADSGGLSAGQAQLLAFARVFLKNPGLVILDEASSRLDPLTEQLIERTVTRLLENRTGIIIAHRLKTVERANQILILEQEQVVEYGDRAVLMRDPQSRFSRLSQLG